MVLDNHVHSRETCEGIAVVTWVDRLGTIRDHALSCSRCPLNPDSIETIVKHFESWTKPGEKALSVKIYTIKEWEDLG